MNKSESATKRNLFSAAKKLAGSEIELIKAIENSTNSQNRYVTTSTMSSGAKNKNSKQSRARPSATLIAAKREAALRQASHSKEKSQAFVHDIYQKALDAYSTTYKNTGLVYDYSMAEHKCLWDPKYPECPERLTQVLKRCKELGLIDRCRFINPRLATEDELLTKHSQAQINILKATEGCTDIEKLETISSKYDAVYIHPSTYRLSLLSAGSAINLVEAICKKDVQNGMAIIRPPGHHAMESEYCGYCFFNNVAIAAESALSKQLATKVLIVDWDVHHGQATQQMFYNDPRVVYFSIHRYENGTFWPNLRESEYDYVGEGLGEGYNFNIPLNKTGMTNADYIAIFQQVLLPMAYEFQPDLVIVSAGYDAAVGCPEGEMEITPACYAHLVSSLMSLANGKVAVILEGGYCLKSLAESAALTLRTLLGDPCPVLQTLDAPSTSIRDTILNVIYAHKPYWNCYQYQDTYSVNSTVNNQDEKQNRHLPVVIYKGEAIKPDFYETRDCYPVQSKGTLDMIEDKINALIQFTNLTVPPNRVCFVYDNRMLKHYNLSDNTHPEKPSRIAGIYKRHEDNGLLERCLRLQGRSATLEELLLVHSENYVKRIQKTKNMKMDELRKQASEYKSIYLHTDTWATACVSAGSLLQVVDSVLNGESRSGVALIRPPGHHAEDDAACGFCIFNNVAIAARYAMECHHLERVLIIDWDVHHGNGTQSIFEEDPKVLYVSVHRYDNGAFFPNSKKANYTFVGTGKGEGYNVNIPWNKKGMTDAEYIAAFQQIVMPIAYQFNPELILVSAGFDACIGDPLGGKLSTHFMHPDFGCVVTPELYGHLTHWLSSLANGRVILSLEGGYNIHSISHAMTMCTKALLGDPLPMLEPRKIPCTSAVHSINNVLKTHKQYWRNLIFNLALPKEKVLQKIKTSTTKTIEPSRFIDKLSKHQSKIALERIESEKLDLNLSLNKIPLNLVTEEEILKLQNEVENLKIKNSEKTSSMKSTAKEQKTEAKSNEVILEVSQCKKECTNKREQGGSGRQGPSSSKAGSYNSSDNNGGEGELSRGAAATTLFDYLSDNLQALMIAGEMFAVVPLRECPHLDTVRDVPESGIDVNSPCTECRSTAENWICLECYTVHCARNVNQHALLHNDETQHPMTLSFSDLSVWCYGCEAYIDNPRLYMARNAAHRSKFNEDLPWTYETPMSAHS